MDEEKKNESEVTQDSPSTPETDSEIASNIAPSEEQVSAPCQSEEKEEPIQEEEKKQGNDLDVQKLSDGIISVQQAVESAKAQVSAIAETESRILTEVHEMHKLYHNEFAGRLKSMQDELERYRKVESGRAFDDILSAIARIYGNNETLADEVDDAKAKKNIRYLLMDLEDLLDSYGMSKLRSEVGDKRNTRHCQVLNRIPTDDPTKHDTIAKSYNSGFYIGNRTVIKEVVDVYVYEAPTAKEDNTIIETDEKTLIEE